MILRDARILVGPFDLSADHSEVTLSIGMADLDGTHFGHRAEAVVAGLGQIELTGTGFVRPGPDGPDRALRGQLGAADIPVTIMSGDPGAEDAAVETFLAQTFQYRSGAQVGQLYAFSYTAKGQGHLPAVGKQITIAQPITTDGTSAAYQFVVAAGRRLVVTLHVLRVSGSANPALTMVLESDSAAGFPSPTPAATFADVTAPGGWLVIVAGPVSDDNWRMKWTVKGNTPSFDAVLAIGLE